MRNIISWNVSKLLEPLDPGLFEYGVKGTGGDIFRMVGHDYTLFRHGMKENIMTSGCVV